MTKSNLRPRPPSLVLSRSHSLSKKSPKSTTANRTAAAVTSPGLLLSASANSSPSNTTHTHSPTDRIPPTPPLPNQIQTSSSSSHRPFPTSPPVNPSSLPVQPTHNDMSTPPLHPTSHSHSSAPKQPSLPPPPGPITPAGVPFLDFLKTWSDDQVSRWLSDIRLPHLSSIFSENDIVGDVILDVDQAALKEMGVTKVGDRVKLIVAVKDLKQRCVRDRDQRALRNAISSVHLNINHNTNNNHPHPSTVSSFPTSANSNWNSDSPCSASVTVKEINTYSASPGRERSGSIRQHSKAIPPPLRLTERVEALPRAYQTSATIAQTMNRQQASSSHPQAHPQSSNNNLLSSSSALLPPVPQMTSRGPPGPSPRSGGTTTAHNELHGLPQHPSVDFMDRTRPSRRSRNPNDSTGVQTSSPTKNILTRAPTASVPITQRPPQASNWTSEFGLPRAPGPEPLTRQSSWSSNTPTPAPGSNPAISSGATAPLFIKKSGAEHRKAPSFGGGSIKPGSLTGSNASSTVNGNIANSGQISPTGSGTSSTANRGAGLTSIIEDTIVAPQPPSNDGHSTSAGRGQGFKVGRGGFKRPTTPAGTVGVVAGAMSQMSNSQPTLDEVIRRTIKVTLSETGIMKTINVENLNSANEFMDRVIKKFSQVNAASQLTLAGRVLDMDEWILCPMPLGGVKDFNRSPMKELNEHELLDICKSVNRPERQRGLLLRQVFNFQQQQPKRSHPSSSPTAVDVSLPLTPGTEQDLDEIPAMPQQQPRKQRHRASVVSVMSGLMVDPFRHSEPLPPDFAASLAAHQAASQSATHLMSNEPTEERATSFLSTGKGKLRNFFGHRPPSELISNYLVDYFPQVEKKKNLSKSVRMSVRKSLAMRRSSAFSTQNQCAGSDESGRETSWDMSNYPGMNHNQLSDISRFSSDSAVSAVAGRFTSPRISIDNSPPVDGSPVASSDQSSAVRKSLNPGRERKSHDFPRGQLSVCGNRDSDNVSMLTVDEVTAEVEHRRMSLGGGDFSEDGENDTARVGGGALERARKSVSGVSIRELMGHGHGGESDMEDNEEAADDESDEDEDEDDEDEDEDEEEEEKDNHDDPQKMTSSGSKASIKWVRGALIGAGSFGSVYLGMHALNGTLMAVKQVERPTGTSHNEERKKSMLSALVREIEFLKELQHMNIVQYLDSSADDCYFNIFLEYVPGGSVSTLLKNYGSFEEALVKTFTRQILDGLSYLHSKEIIHRDIKGANILVDNKGVIKISDFGISKRVEDNLLSTARVHRPSLQGSVFWMAPEVVKQTSYTRKADIWSLGCLIVEMLTGEHPWANLTQMQAIFRIGSFATPEIPDDITDDCIDLLKQTFLIDHHARPTADQLSDHAFFKPDELPRPPPTANTVIASISQETPTRSSFETHTATTTVIKITAPPV